MFNKKNKEIETCVFCGHVKEVKHDIICQIKAGIEDFLCKNYRQLGEDITISRIETTLDGRRYLIICHHEKSRLEVGFLMPAYPFENGHDQLYLNNNLKENIPLVINEIYENLLIYLDENKELKSKLDKIEGADLLARRLSNKLDKIKELVNE